MDQVKLRERISVLQREHERLTLLAKQAGEGVLACVGHLTEANHWLNALLAAEKAAAEIVNAPSEPVSDPVAESAQDTA